MRDAELRVFFKSRAPLPLGTRRKYGDCWFVRTATGWEYDEMVDPKRGKHTVGRKSGNVASTPVAGVAAAPVPASAPAPPAAVSPPPVPDPAVTAANVAIDRRSWLLQMSPGDVAHLRRNSTRRDRITEGQDVWYNGGKHGKYRGQKGVVVGMGKDGAALVRMPDNWIIDSAWASLKPAGPLKPFSIFDRVPDSGMYRMSADMHKAVTDIMDHGIGASGITYRRLCEHFQKKGFNLLIVGGTVRDLLQGKDANDVDFICDCSDRELLYAIKELNPNWTLEQNSHLGLVKIRDNGEDVDITPIHKYHADTGWMCKGWNLRDDAEARDFTANTLQLDPLKGVVVDATGTGVDGCMEKSLNFCNTAVLKGAPRYVLRAFKFIGRGYKPTPETEAAIRENLPRISTLKPVTMKRWIENQIAEKDGVPGLERFRDTFKKYDGAGLWAKYVDVHWREVMRDNGGMP
jgi:hypothetical protein